MRLLIVDDERELTAALCQGFQQANIDVDVAWDGTKGLKLATDREYDVIVLDRALPGLDGLTVCCQLRLAGKQVGIVMLTAMDGVDDRVDGLNAGADDYLVKPFAFKELLARVRAVIRRHAHPHQRQIQVGPLTVDLEAGQIVLAGAPLPLSRKEYVLLLFMLLHPGELLTYERLRAHGWEGSQAPSIEGVRAHVKNLRKKLQPSAYKLLKTVHGLGYRVEV